MLDLFSFEQQNHSWDEETNQLVFSFIGRSFIVVESENDRILFEERIIRISYIAYFSRSYRCNDKFWNVNETAY